MGRKTKITLIILGFTLLGMQVIRPDRTNPVSDPALTYEAIEKPAPERSAVLRRACANCHTNETEWPWYSHIAPVSWLVANDVKEAREHLNLSEWGRLSPDKRAKALEEMCEEASHGDMPPWEYRLLHREAKLGEQGVGAICAAIPEKK